MFITTVTRHREPVFAVDSAARIAVESLYGIQAYYPFFLFAFVIMPDHAHLLLRVPSGGSISKIMNVYKRAVSFNIGQGPVWQSRFHIVLPDDVHEVRRYIHDNPVKGGFVDSPEKYSWSSASGRWDVADLGD